MAKGNLVADSHLINFKIAGRVFIDELKSVSADPTRFSVPLPEGALRNALNRLRMGEVTVLGGFEGHGKSALAEQIAFGAARHFASIDMEDVSEEEAFFGDGENRQMGVLYCSLEMGWQQLLARALAQHSHIGITRLLEPERISSFEWDDIEKQVELIGSWPVQIFDSSILRTGDLPGMVDLCRQQYDIKLVVVDYIQLLANQAQSGNEVAKLDEIIRDLKELSRSRGLHVIALSSLNRNNSDGDVPTSMNLRGSGGIAFGADNVLLLHRPKLSNPNLDEQWNDVAILNVAKQRNGPVGMYYLKWDKTQLRFQNLDPWLTEHLPPLKRNRYAA